MTTANIGGGDTMGYQSYEVLLLNWRALISLPGITRTGSMGIISAVPSLQFVVASGHGFLPTANCLLKTGKDTPNEMCGKGNYSAVNARFEQLEPGLSHKNVMCRF
jgi:hypothetical protein